MSQDLNKYILIIIISITFYKTTNTQYCVKDVKDCSNLKARYLFYDVNPPEGFNLRRDVYMRYAIFIHSLAKSSVDNLNNFKLVLPPWSTLYHWTQKNEPNFLPWSRFFDLESLQRFAPVIEMHQFFQEIGVKYGNIFIDEVYVLQHYKDMFSSGKFEEKMSVDECNNDIGTNFFYYKNITSKNMKCLSFHGFTSHLSKLLEKSNAQTILFDHGEVALHDRFGDKIYWKCRRSMRFNKDLKLVANDFRRIYLNSSDVEDNTILPNNWMQEIGKRNAIGGPYLSVHLRRRDFVWARPKQVPNLKNTAKQILNKLKSLELNTVFIATDMSIKEYEELELMLTPEINVFKYKPNKEIKKFFKDGGIAIIEQIICSYARYFMGTYESTFSFRIQEEREILGFHEDTTFNRFCGNDEITCEHTSMWKIVY